MSPDDGSSDSVQLLRLRVTAEADPGALARVIERFQNLNVVPRRIVAEIGGTNLLHVQVDIVGLSEERMTLIAAKVRQCASVIESFWHHC